VGVREGEGHCVVCEGLGGCGTLVFVTQVVVVGGGGEELRVMLGVSKHQAAKSSSVVMWRSTLTRQCVGWQVVVEVVVQLATASVNPSCLDTNHRRRSFR